MIDIRTLFVGIIGVVVTLSARADDMYDALGVMLRDNPVIAEMRERVGAADADVERAKSGYKPYLGLSANVNLAHSEILGTDYDYVPSSVGAEFGQNLFAGFSTVAQIKAATALRQAQYAGLQSTEQDVLLDAINAYINVLNARRVMELNENNRRVLGEYYDFVSGRASVGMATHTDVAQAGARLDGARYGLTDACTQYENAIETYRRIYGNVPKDFVDVDIKRVGNVFPESLDQAAEIALRIHPGLIALKYHEDAARADGVLAMKTRLPSVDLRASAVQMNDIPIVDRVRDGRVGVYVSVPIYDRGASSAGIEKARFTVAGIREHIANTRRIVIENLNHAWNVYAAQSTAIDAARSAVRANEMALAGVRDEATHGRRTVLDVLNAEQELLNSRVALTRAEHARVSAFFAVLAAMGRLNAETLGLTRE